MKEISITTIYGYIAPYAAPVPSAYVLGVSVYHSILTVTGEEYWWIAAGAAMIGMVGIESTGGLSAILVSRAFVQKSWEIMWMAIGAVVGYACFVAWGIYSSKDSRPMISTVAITLLAYFVVALWEGMRALEKKKAEEASTAAQAAQNHVIEIQAEADRVAKEAQAKVAELEFEIKKLDAERLLMNSRVRLEKASSGQSGQSGQMSGASGGQPSVSGGQNGQGYKFDPAILQAVIDFLKKHDKPDGVTVREIERENLGIKKTVAALYKSEALRRIAIKQEHQA